MRFPGVWVISNSRVLQLVHHPLCHRGGETLKKLDQEEPPAQIMKVGSVGFQILAL